MDRIGIPRGFLYYRYGILWKSFFDVLEIPYIVSDNTTYKWSYSNDDRELIEQGYVSTGKTKET